MSLSTGCSRNRACPYWTSWARRLGKQPCLKCTSTTLASRCYSSDRRSRNFVGRCVMPASPTLLSATLSPHLLALPAPQTYLSTPRGTKGYTRRQLTENNSAVAPTAKEAVTQRLSASSSTGSLSRMPPRASRFIGTGRQCTTPSILRASRTSTSPRTRSRTSALSPFRSSIPASPHTTSRACSDRSSASRAWTSSPHSLSLHSLRLTLPPPQPPSTQLAPRGEARPVPNRP